MSKNAATREALKELAAEADEQHKLLKEIKGMLMKVLDNHNEEKAKTMDAFDRLGTRVLRTENRVGALELVAGKR